MMGLEFIIESGRLKGQTVALPPDRSVTVGRSVRSDIQIPDEGVSRLHCRFEYEGERLFVVDLNSSNGTLVNGERVTRRALAVGDRVALGPLLLRLRMTNTESDTEAVPPIAATTVTLVQDAPQPDTAIRRKYDHHTTALPSAAEDDPTVARLRQRLSAICRMANAIYQETELAHVFEVAADAIMAVTGADRGAILLRDENTQELKIVAARSGAATAAGREFRVSRTIVEEAMRQGVSILSTDAAADDRFKSGLSVVMQNIHSAMCVPLRAEEKILGAIYVDSLSLASIFTETELALLSAVGQQAGMAIERARLVRDLENLFVGAMHTLVATIEAKDPYTRGHSQRVTALALLLSAELGLAADERCAVELAGVLHDVGKIAVPEALLRKPAVLSEEEFAIIQRHPSDGARIIRNMPELDRIVRMSDVLAAVEHHHERYDGKGYPGRLRGSAIPRIARILAVCDTFDAITSDRPYRRARASDAAMAVLEENAAAQFDPECVCAFKELHRRGATEALDKVVGRFRVTAAMSPAAFVPAPALSPAEKGI
ncbi:MAG: HD domain-containing protein [Planctomycetota bacterium]|nr:HD domain-containing protein [Planctomycetota bacterium]